jgi:hypothetical protein
MEFLSFLSALCFYPTADIISSSSTESNEYDSRFELDLENGIYPAPYNAGSSLTVAAATMSFTFLFFRVLLQFFYL